MSGDGTELIGKVADHFFTEEFQAVIDGFISEHCRKFVGCDESQVEGEDNKLEYWAVYQKFLGLFEEKLEEFLASEGASAAEFYRMCKRVSNSGNNWGDDATFINLLVATSDYGSFIRLMKEEADDAKDFDDRDDAAEESKDDEEGKGDEEAAAKAASEKK